MAYVELDPFLRLWYQFYELVCKYNGGGLRKSGWESS